MVLLKPFLPEPERSSGQAERTVPPALPPGAFTTPAPNDPNVIDPETGISFRDLLQQEADRTD